MTSWKGHFPGTKVQVHGQTHDDCDSTPKSCTNPNKPTTNKKQNKTNNKIAKHPNMEGRLP